jgi:tol-pal system protein YbgF
MLGQEPAREVPGQAALIPTERATRKPIGRFLVAVLLLGGCTSVADVTGTATQQDLMQLRADVTALQLNYARTKAELEKQAGQGDSRTREEAAHREQQTAELARRLDALSSSVSSLSARLDTVATRLDALNRRVTAAPAAPAPAAPAPTTSTPAQPAPSPPAGARPATGALQPQDVYQAAYIDFSKGSYALAIAGFREFLRRYPDHDLAGSAQYWIGEAHFSMARAHANAGQADKATESLQQAVQEFKKVIANYPRSDKAPTSLYKEALALIELKQPALAQARLQYLIETFPQAEETPLAKERLATLKAG